MSADPGVLRAGLQPSHLIGAHLDARPAPRMIPLPPPGPEPRRASLDIIVFDDSGTVSGAGGADPIGNRYAEAWHAIRWLQLWTTTQGPKVSVLHFDHECGASGIVPLASKGAPRRIRKSLREPCGAAGTSQLGGVLHIAEEQARGHAEGDVRLTVFSDFELTDGDTTQVYERLNTFPGHVRAVVLDAAAPEELAEHVHVNHRSPSDPPGSLALSLFYSLASSRNPGSTL